MQKFFYSYGLGSFLEQCIKQNCAFTQVSIVLVIHKLIEVDINNNNNDDDDDDDDDDYDDDYDYDDEIMR